MNMLLYMAKGNYSCRRNCQSDNFKTEIILDYPGGPNVITKILKSERRCRGGEKEQQEMDEAQSCWLKRQEASHKPRKAGSL